MPDGNIPCRLLRGIPPMSVKLEVITPKGILDSTKAEEFRQMVDEMLTAGVNVILIDLKDITFIDSSGLGTLVVILKQVRGLERKLYICSINDQVRMLFELTSMDRVFEVYEDRAAFERAVLKA
jgi:anti-anti-sigma factor